jgi:fluoride exporter
MHVDCADAHSDAIFSLLAMTRQHLVLGALVALGGAVGSVCRWLVGLAVPVRADLPLGTLAVNVGGGFLIGFLMRPFSSNTPTHEMQALLVMGFCGGFTTFSAFSLESARLLERGLTGRAALYVASSVCLSIAATFAGHALRRPS